MASAAMIHASVIRRFERERAIAMNMRIAAAMYQQVIQRAPVVEPDFYASEAAAANMTFTLPIGFPGVDTEADRDMPIGRFVKIMGDIGDIYESSLSSELDSLRSSPGLGARMLQNPKSNHLINERTSILNMYQAVFDLNDDGYLIPKEMAHMYGIDQVQVTHQVRQSTSRGPGG